MPARPRDEMATALIVWHGAVAAFCQKSSSDSPMEMMTHLTNASSQNRPATPIQRGKKIKKELSGGTDELPLHVVPPLREQ